MMRRLLAIWHARNLEFVKDRGTLVFSVLFPVLLVVGMSFVLGSGERAVFKVGVLTEHFDAETHPFLGEKYVDFVVIENEDEGLRRITRHQLDLLIDLRKELRYWVNTDSPKGYIAERLLRASDHAAKRNPISGAALRYVDWLFPGILGMNMMFSCLFGVGYVVVRYRKSGFLKRLQATPLTAFEFLSAQVLSRLVLILAVTVFLYFSIASMIDFHSSGSLLLLGLIATTGALAMIALGLTVAARFASEEVVAGVLNLFTWPMMLMSGVWFSLEDSPQWVQTMAALFPLTHVLDAARAVMFDGAGLDQVFSHVAYLAIMALAFLAFGAWSFRWRVE